MPGVDGQVRALEDEAVEIAPGKADLDADSGLDLVSQIRRHGVVEGTIQVGQAVSTWTLATGSDAAVPARAASRRVRGVRGAAA